MVIYMNKKNKCKCGSDCACKKNSNKSSGCACGSDCKCDK